jgi:hypothetical protein
MKFVLWFLLFAFLISLVLLAPAIVTGSLLRLVFPSVDRGMSILIGLVASVSAIHFMIRLYANLRRFQIYGGEEYEQEDEEEADEAGRARSNPPFWTPPSSERPSWRRRRKRR